MREAYANGRYLSFIMHLPNSLLSTDRPHSPLAPSPPAQNSHRTTLILNEADYVSFVLPVAKSQRPDSSGDGMGGTMLRSTCDLPVRSRPRLDDEPNNHPYNFHRNKFKVLILTPKLIRFLEMQMFENLMEE